jgi:hypothetical protein
MTNDKIMAAGGHPLLDRTEIERFRHNLNCRLDTCDWRECPGGRAWCEVCHRGYRPAALARGGGGRDMTVDIQNLLDQGERHARSILLERREKSLAPLFHLVSPDGKHDAVVQVSWNNEITKQLRLIEVRRIAEEINAVASLMISEAWMVKAPKAPTAWHAQQALERMGPPSQSPERVEVVSLAADNGTEKVIRLLQMIRDKPGGRVISLVLMTEGAEFPGQGTRP